MVAGTETVTVADTRKMSPAWSLQGGATASVVPFSEAVEAGALKLAAAKAHADLEVPPPLLISASSKCWTQERRDRRVLGPRGRALSMVRPSELETLQSTPPALDIARVGQQHRTSRSRNRSRGSCCGLGTRSTVTGSCARPTLPVGSTMEVPAPVFPRGMYLVAMMKLCVLELHRSPRRPKCRAVAGSESPLLQ